MLGIGPIELFVILLVGLLVLGPKRLPEIARSLGRGLSEFRRASNDLRQSLALEDDLTQHAPPPRPPDQTAMAPQDDPAEGRRIDPKPETAPEGEPSSSATGEAQDSGAAKRAAADESSPGETKTD